MRVDERSAGFLALGLAKRSGSPVPVITTSGHRRGESAARGRGGVEQRPTAGRALRGSACGASQDRRQPDHRPGARVRRHRALVGRCEAPTRARGQVAYWRSTVSRACAVATHSWQRGPVHLNVAFRDPLVPDDDDMWVEPLTGHDGESFVDEDGDELQVVRTWTVDRRLMLSVQEPIDELLEDIAAPELPERGLVIVGDIDDPEDAAAAVDLAQSWGGRCTVNPLVWHGRAATLWPTPASERAAFVPGEPPGGPGGHGRESGPCSRGVLAMIREAGLHIHAGAPAHHGLAGSDADRRRGTGVGAGPSNVRGRDRIRASGWTAG